MAQVVEAKVGDLRRPQGLRPGIAHVKGLAAVGAGKEQGRVNAAYLGECLDFRQGQICQG